MIKTLYVRVVLTFLAAILFALLAASALGLFLYRQELNELERREMTDAGESIVRMYERMSVHDPDAFVSGVSTLTTYPVRLLTGTEDPAIYGAIKEQFDVQLSPEAVEQVLNGSAYRSTGNGEGVFVGLPLRFQGKAYALFLLPSSRNEGLIIRLFLTILLLVLAFGSLFIVIAARYLIRPLKVLTQATKRLAKGDFDVELQLKRSDELGTLAQSFNEMARELKQLETMRRDFVSNVSHEIQSPLTSISGFAKTLRENRLVTDDNRSRYLDIILTESGRLSRLSDNLLKLASLESEHHPFELRTFHLDEQLRQVIVACEPQWSAKGIRVDVKLPSAVKIQADADQLNQVWLNLLGNSIKFTPSGGRVGIELTFKRQRYTVKISDTGPGMPSEELTHIFKRFYKIDRSRSSGGSGLGLAIVKRIVSLHGGDIEVQSRLGEGSVFLVTLPEMAIAPAAPRESAH